jgi:UDP-N-acetylmuramoyl-tripeptide--D-alanyl-D-alanine ligase
MLSLSTLSEKIGADYCGDDMPLPGVSIDTRTLQPGDVFVAITGPNFDGHAFIESAVEKGAAAVMVSEKQNISVPHVMVKDTTHALGQLAKVWRAQFDIPVIGLTGSCGKTTTKEMMACILGEAGNVLYTQGNQNNYYGVPLTLLKLRPEHDFAVIEMGTNAPGEIEYLAEITKPTVALITNIHEQHVEGLASAAGIAREKSAIYKHLAQTGTMIVNHDEPFSQTWTPLRAGRDCLAFSADTTEDVCATHLNCDATGTRFNLCTPMGGCDITVPLLGEYMVHNALAAAAATMAAGATLEQIQIGLKKTKAYPGRLCLHRVDRGATVIDDTYNASPISVKHALNVLDQFGGHRIAVVTHMGELGTQAQHYHEQVGQWFNACSADQLYVFGDKTLLNFVLAECPRAQYMADKNELIEQLRKQITPQTTVLVKGSRVNKMEEVVQALCEVKEEVVI